MSAKPLAYPRSATMLLLIALLPLTACSMSRNKAIKLTNKAMADVREGRTSDAVKLLEEATKEDPTYADPPYYAGQIYDQKYSQPLEAEKYYQMALARDTSNAQFHYRLGSVLATRGKHDDAARHFEAATKKHKNFAKAWFRLGLSQIAIKKYPAAVKSLMASIKSDPLMRIGKEDRGGAHYHALGDLYLRFHLPDHAAAVYTNGLKTNGGSPRMAHGLGVASLQQKKYPEAIASFKAALKLDPSDTTAYFNLLVAQKEGGKYEDALATLDEFLGRADPSRDGVRISAAGGLRQELQQLLAKKKKK